MSVPVFIILMIAF